MKRLLLALTFAAMPAILAAQAPAPAAGPTDRLMVDQYWDYETVADPQISPDGSQIIYTRQWFNKLNDKRESSLWMMNADGARNRFLVAGSNCEVVALRRPHCLHRAG